MAVTGAVPTKLARLRDGRAVTFSATGPEDGFPVVYCHGAIGSPRWCTPELEALTERAGIRYLVVNRPGFSGSDPSPGRTVADFARDLGELMSSLGHRRFSVVGVSAGAPYALACGWALADRLAGLAAVSPLGPPDAVAGASSLRYRVAPAPLRTALLGPWLAQLCLRGLRLAGDTAPQAMIDDYLVCRRNWGFHPSEVRSPVTVWHARGDRLVPLAHTLSLAAAIPGCSTRVDPRGGHFFYSRRIADIVGALVPGAAAIASAAEVTVLAPCRSSDTRPSASASGRK
jgi:pimeloyl-ACP methyl ester carboxylesterase